MSALLDDLRTRLAGLLAGTYTAGGRYVTGATLAESPVTLPLENPEWPPSVVDRTWDLVWTPSGMPLTFETPGGQADAYQGPHVTLVGALLRVQYQIARPDSLAPPEADLSLGAFEACSRKAVNDAAALRFIFMLPAVWNGVALDCAIGPSTGVKADALRWVQTIPLTWKLSTSAATAPGWG